VSNRVALADRVRQARRLLEAEGAHAVANRLRRRGAALLMPASGRPLPISMEDMRSAARVMASGRGLPAPLPWQEGEPLSIAWVDLTPSEGSGGQTTMYRMVEALEAAGHRCTVYLVEHHGWSIEQHRRTIASWWPGVRAEVRAASDGIEDAHAILSTCWESVYPSVASSAAGVRLYFIQDYEPLFHAAGSRSLMAEATYRFGLHGITAGRWLAQKMEREFGMTADHFDFGCDTDVYRLDTAPGAAERRTGICYYCRPSSPRRAHELAMVALQLFSEEHPEVEIHLYGERAGHLPFRATEHGLLTPAQLNELYNRCVAGLTLSATNVSLVPPEMLASGCVPVVNDADHNRIVLANDHVRYAAPTPFDLAHALGDLVSRPMSARVEVAAAAAASVVGMSWAAAAQRVEEVIREQVRIRQARPMERSGRA
jgi:glycosyltransferase involved in cell wall biosynthesis